jgi:hypothetical protein
VSVRVSCIQNTQIREETIAKVFGKVDTFWTYQRVPLKFTQFMDGRELHEAILREKSGGGTTYEVEVYYDVRGEMFFRGGWPQFVEDHNLHQGFFMIFNYHCGTLKFDMKIFDGTQCQKKYEAEVHFQ